MSKNANDRTHNFGVLDFETDPFKYGRIPFPFACGIYFSPDSYRLLWGKNIIEETVAFVKKLPRCTLYAHNGGKFDFFYLVECANFGTIVVRNGRIFEMQIGKVTLRDSWPLMPFALEEYRKTKIDYSIFEENKRESTRNKLQIQSYLYDDCKNLHDLLTGFREIVGPKDTIGSAAFFQMKKLGLKIPSLDETHDDIFRPYFYGGRVQAFERGIFHGNYKYLDINSAYPYAMLHDHPSGVDYKRYHKNSASRSIMGSDFISLDCFSEGVFPVRSPNNSLDFPYSSGTFYVTGWELLAALETNSVRLTRINEIWRAAHTINFTEYVEKFYALRHKAKKAGDKIASLAYKYLLNSGYGKFAQNPRDFKEYCLQPFGAYPNDKNWQWETDYGAISLWSKPSFDGSGFYDVATAASITGFQRAQLWRGIVASDKVLYTDTDAILCKHSRVKIGENLGEWKHEGTAKECCIAGKKLYALRSSGACFDGSREKIASKGARLTYAEVKSLCAGESVIWKKAAPTFSAGGGASFIEREINLTGDNDDV